LNEDQAADFAVRQQRFNAPLSQDGLGIEDDIEVVRAKYVIGADGKSGLSLNISLGLSKCYDFYGQVLTHGFARHWGSQWTESKLITFGVSLMVYPRQISLISEMGQ